MAISEAEFEAMLARVVAAQAKSQREELAALVARMGKAPASAAGSWLRGASRSITVWWSIALGAVVAGWDTIAGTFNDGVIAELTVSPVSRWAIGAAITIVGIYIRSITTQPLAAK